MKRRTLTLLMILTAAVAWLPATIGNATKAGKNGRIVFSRYLGDAHTTRGLFTIDPDGSGLRQLTNPPAGVQHISPDWSPNGRWITYSSERWVGPGAQDVRRQVWIIRANGTDKQNISRPTCPSPNKPYAPNKCSGDLDPSWSPDGTHIAFSRHFGDSSTSSTTEIFVMDADGTDPVLITEPGERFEDFSPQWSSDGGKLVLTRFDRQRGKDAVVTVWLDGTHEKRLTPWSMNAGDGPDWSPDDRWILFRGHLDQCHPQTNIFMIHPNGTGLRKVTDTVGCTTQWLSSSFSSNGKKITTSIVMGVEGVADVVVLSLRGAVLRNVTRSGAWESFADWGPKPTVMASSSTAW